MNRFIIFIFIVFVSIQCDARMDFCVALDEESKVQPLYVEIGITNYIITLNPRKEGYHHPVNELRHAETKIRSNQLPYVASLYKYLCDGEFKKTSINGFKKADNYIGIFFMLSCFENCKHKIIEEVFSTDGNYLYAGNGKWAREVDKAFRLKFNFSDEDIVVIGAH